jgi:hypothetical protein
LDRRHQPGGPSGETEPEALRLQFGGVHGSGVSKVAFQHGRDLVGEFPAGKLEGDLEVQSEAAVVEVGKGLWFG